MDKTIIYEQCREVPKDAQKPIAAGRLKGKTDINPMWRIKKLTELFGPAGMGWKFDPPVFEEKTGAKGEVVVQCFTNLYVRQDDGEAWSAPIPGIGGSMLIAMESGGLRTDDDAYKKRIRMPRAWPARRLESARTCTGRMTPPSTPLFRTFPPRCAPAAERKSSASKPRTGKR